MGFEVEAGEASDRVSSKQLHSSTENVSCLLVKGSSPQVLNSCTQEHKTIRRKPEQL